MAETTGNLVKNILKIKMKIITGRVRGRNIHITDFPLATSIMSLGYQLLAIEPGEKDPKRLEFLFEETEAIDRVVAGYWNGNLLIEPKTFWNIARELKSRIRIIK